MEIQGSDHDILLLLAQENFLLRHDIPAIPNLIITHHEWCGSENIVIFFFSFFLFYWKCLACACS